MPRFILISGCSGGGKSTLLAELAARGHDCVPEPGARIVAEELAGSGAALPWVDMAAFAHRALAMARVDLAARAEAPGPVFFDRGLVDAAVALWHATGLSWRETLGPRRAYADPVFLAPPWPEIFISDAARRHDFAAARAEYDRLQAAFDDLGYACMTLPRAPLAARVDFVLGCL